MEEKVSAWQRFWRAKCAGGKGVAECREEEGRGGDSEEGDKEGEEGKPTDEESGSSSESSSNSREYRLVYRGK